MAIPSRRPAMSSRTALHLLAVLLLLGASTPCLSQADATATKPARRLVLVGYGLQNDKVAQDVLRKMAASAKAAGVDSKVLMAGENEDELRRALGEAFQRGSGPRLELLSRGGTAPCKVSVRHGPVKSPAPAAWIGFYRKDAPAKKYISYTFLNNLTDRLYDVKVEEAGLYNFRIFLDKGYKTATVSATVQVE